MKLSKADRIWAVTVKERDKWSCLRCEKGYVPHQARGLQAHHVFTRSRKSTRLELENGVTLCTGCHRWAHSNPLEFHAWIKLQLGSGAYDALQQRSRKLKGR